MNEFRSLRVLIVDPSGYSRDVFRTVLTAVGVQHITAIARTDQALQTLRTDLFNVVFCDEMVEPLDAFTFLKTFRRDPKALDVTTPVILVSAGADPTTMESARMAGMNDFLTKPGNPETLDRMLSGLLFRPRPFVNSKTYIGPDRRSGDRQFGLRAPGGVDRRKAPG